VLLVNLGPLAQHTTRATFAKNLLAAGGIEAVWSEPLAGGEAVASAFRTAGTTVAALCSSDEVYADLAADAARALKAVGCGLVLLLGRPGERGPEMEAAGVDLFVHAGRDMVEILTGLHDRLATPAAETAP
jgi:methylmalonyl-CoA mutase